jgi:acylphosphatase
MSAGPQEEIIEAHLFVQGRVQGVCFRMYCQQEAERCGLTGWVRNLSDGRVEIVAQGPASALKPFLAWCRKGPPAARVDRLTSEESSSIKRSYTDFEIW